MRRHTRQQLATCLIKNAREDGRAVERRGRRGYFWRESMWDVAEEGYGYCAGGCFVCKQNRLKASFPQT